jgi:hypothetical protein
MPTEINEIHMNLIDFGRHFLKRIYSEVDDGASGLVSLESSFFPIISLVSLVGG